MSVKLADCRDEWIGACRVAYDAYRKIGITVENPVGIRVTPYQVLPTSAVLVATTSAGISSTLTMVQDASLGLPAAELYGQQVSLLRLEGRKLAEVSCFADDTDGNKSSLSTLFELMSLVVQCCQANGADTVVIEVHPRHAEFYERFLGFERIGSERNYEPVLGAPAMALVLDLVNLEKINVRGHKRLFGHVFPTEELTPREMPEEVRAELIACIPDLHGSSECRVGPCRQCYRICRRRVAT